MSVVLGNVSISNPLNAVSKELINGFLGHRA
jgi:hypothetical protein